MDFKSFINEQWAPPRMAEHPHVIEHSGMPSNERYFIGWKKDLPRSMVNDNFADGQYGTYEDAVKFPSKEAAEVVVARIEKEDGYNVYASPLED